MKKKQLAKPEPKPLLNDLFLSNKMHMDINVVHMRIYFSRQDDCDEYSFSSVFANFTIGKTTKTSVKSKSQRLSIW